jgi:hypothetical protein
MTKQQDQDLLVRGIDPDANPNQNVIDPEHYFGQYSTVCFLFHINVASSVLDP